METFLDNVVQNILVSHTKMDQIKIIVPNIRAISFLKESFKKFIDRPLLAPEILTISEFITELSGLQPLSKTDSIYLFYETYKSLTPESKLESFTQFLSWAPTLIKEFNEIDNQLINAKELFNFMNALNSIEAKGGLNKRHFNLSKNGFDYYLGFYDIQIKRQKGYSGLQLREAVKNLTFYLEQKLPFHLFIGFNALTKAEETIIQELIAEGNAEIIWDIDKTFYEDPYHSAGHFIRKYYSQWKVLKRKEKPQFPKLFSKAKEVEIIGTAKNVIQAKTAVQIASDLYEKNPESSTVIVLGDENLLEPILSYLPEKELAWNVTMGYPLKKTTLYSFFKSFFELHENHGEYGYRFKDVLEFSRTIHCIELLKSNQSRIDHWIEQSNLNFIASKGLINKNPIGTLMFSPFNGVEGFLEKLIEITQNLKSKYLKKGSEDFEIETCNRFLNLFNSLKNRFNEFKIMNSLADIKTIFDSLVQQESFNFRGDTTGGVQIMGLLETRLLDFENVIITNVNEGILPVGKTPFSWIPFDVRKKFKMNTFIEQDHLYAYHFFRLLQRAKNIFLIYNSSAEGLFSGERSRFLIQLEYFNKPLHNLKIKQLELTIPTLDKKLKKINKTKAILNHLEQIGKQGFSPSSLTKYIRNPYEFYEQRMLKVNPALEVNQELTSVDKGTLIHQALEIIYQPYMSKRMIAEYYDEMLKNLSGILERIFSFQIKSTKTKTGKNALLFNIIEEIIKRFLIAEKYQVSAGNKIQILSLEYKFSKSIYIKTLNKKINFKGTVDRIDIFNDQLRIIDYKTGNINESDLSFSSWEELRTKTKKSALFQLVFYVYILKDDFKKKNFIAGVIPLKTFKNNFLAVSQKESLRTKRILKMEAQVLSHFENELFELVREIYDPSVPFLDLN